MNREQKRKIIRTIPNYKTVLKNATEDAMVHFEQMMQEKWTKEEHDDNFNDGDSKEVDNGEDDIYNVE